MKKAVSNNSYTVFYNEYKSKRIGKKSKYRVIAKCFIKIKSNKVKEGASASAHRTKDMIGAIPVTNRFRF